MHHNAILIGGLEFLGWFSVVWGAATFLAFFSIPSVLMQRRGRPQAALAWALVLLTVPVFGLFLWWAIGRQYLKRKRLKRRRATEVLSERSCDFQQDELPSPADSEWEFFQVKKLPQEEAEWLLPPTDENNVELLINSDEAYPVMLDAIRSAKKTIQVMFYIWQADETGEEFRDLLIERAKAGVDIRVLYDAVGSSAVRGGFMKPLLEAGAKVAAFMPPKFFRWSLDLNFRNHRKLIIADGQKAIVGGFNIGNEYKKRWWDTAVLIYGPAVDQLQEIFADDWHFTTGEDYSDAETYGQWYKVEPQEKSKAAVCGVVASGPHTHINLTQEMFFIAINQAQDRIWITTPYFIPDQTILASLRTAVFRGVDVRLIVPANGDSRIVTWAGRSFYPELLRAGVRVFEHQSGFLHAKTAIIDSRVSIVGSANMDLRSFRLNFEVSCLLVSTGFTEDISNLLEQYLSESKELSLTEVENRPYLTRLGESVAHLFSPML